MDFIHYRVIHFSILLVPMAGKSFMVEIRSGIVPVRDFPVPGRAFLGVRSWHKGIRSLYYADDFYAPVFTPLFAGSHALRKERLEIHCCFFLVFAAVSAAYQSCLGRIRQFDGEKPGFGPAAGGRNPLKSVSLNEPFQHPEKCGDGTISRPRISGIFIPAVPVCGPASRGRGRHRVPFPIWAGPLRQSLSI
jgi:hypothetical protein